MEIRYQVFLPYPYCLNMRSFYVLFLLLQVVQLLGQSTTDSLWRIWLDKSQADTTRLRALQSAAWEKLNSNPDSAAIFARMELDYAISTGNQVWEGKALNTLGATYHVKGAYGNALNYYEKSIQILLKTGGAHSAASLYSNIGLIFREQGNTQRALDYYQKFLEIGLERQDKDILSSAYNNIGLIYSDQRNYAKALEYYQKGLAFAMGINSLYDQALFHNNIGSVYYNQNQYNIALKAYQESLELRQKVNDVRGTALMYNNIGLVWLCCMNLVGSQIFPFPFRPQATFTDLGAAI
jgi:tetratricopeptide (TPR) repeat protein